LSVFAWVKTTPGSANGYIFCINNSGSTDRQYGLYWDSVNSRISNVLGSSSVNGTVNTVPANTWAYVGFTWGSDGTAQAYVNGQATGSSINTTATLPEQPNLNIGRRVGGGYLDGFIDELQISNTARSADWIRTEYNNQNDPATFLSAGAEETEF
jgi:hypothetical protein